MAMTAKEKREARAARRVAEAAATATAAETLNRESTISPDKVASAHGTVLKPSLAGAKVTIGCKLGVGWYQLQLFSKTTVDEQTMTGVRQVVKWERTGRVVRVRGTAYPRGTPPAGFPEAPTIVDGAAMTPGIDKDFWDQWVEQNRLNPVVVNGMIFAAEKSADLAAKAREVKEVLSGLEPINPKSDKRMPKSSRGDVSDVATEDTNVGRIDRAIAAATARG